MLILFCLSLILLYLLVHLYLATWPVQLYLAWRRHISRRMTRDSVGDKKWRDEKESSHWILNELRKDESGSRFHALAPLQYDTSSAERLTLGRIFVTPKTVFLSTVKCACPDGFVQHHLANCQ